jgi:hypothetical protein
MQNKYSLRVSIPLLTLKIHLQVPLAYINNRCLCLLFIHPRTAIFIRFIHQLRNQPIPTPIYLKRNPKRLKPSPASTNMHNRLTGRSPVQPRRVDFPPILHLLRRKPTQQGLDLRRCYGAHRPRCRHRPRNGMPLLPARCLRGLCGRRGRGFVLERRCPVGQRSALCGR